ncbi:MAG TPA: hypothetical protein VL422_10290 [Miltoncostaea sp.]|nr:hypothetical protein [Miltoncostaea sp.]
MATGARGKPGGPQPDRRTHMLWTIIVIIVVVLAIIGLLSVLRGRRV